MIAAAAALRGGERRPHLGAGPGSAGLAALWLGFVVLLPLAAVTAEAGTAGWSGFLSAATNDQALDALGFTLLAALAVTAINAVMGTVIAWVLVRDSFQGKALVNALIDLPFALPTIVAGLTLLALYGHGSPVGVDIAFTRGAVLLALLFVTLPFVVRAVQPVLLEIDREAEEAAATLGATPATVLRRIVLPALAPAILAGCALSFGRAVGEFGAVVLISGNIPFETQVASVVVFKQLESGNSAGAAAVSVVLLLISVVVLLALRGLARWGAR